MSTDSKKNLLIIDTDGGTDDCHGILIAAADPNTEILAITCVVGNVELDQVSQNVLRTVHVSEKLCNAHCPIYKGAAKPLMGFPIKKFNVHGDDGLGDAEASEILDEDLIKSEAACLALIRLVNKYPGQITIAAIGPLTNLAVSSMIDPTFSSKIKDLMIMGGDSEGIGNITPCAEFNFCSDPEAALIVLRDFECPKTIISWELTMKYAWDMDWMCNTMLAVDTKVGRFLHDIHQHIIAMCKSHADKTTGGLEDKFPPCDQMAIAISINPALTTTSESWRCAVEVGGIGSRGHLIIDRGCMDPTLDKVTPTRIITGIDFEELKKMCIRSVKL